MPPRSPITNLHEERRLDDAPFGEVPEGVEVADVVALELEARPAGAHPCDGPPDVGERVAKDRVARALEMRPLPVVAPGLGTTATG
jgi:hypothetical protein